ncbi:hypothetical protein M9H77_33100 [Catharanthus roseus]|uniref:Uncharacterized protein n=1 Tax=Catharanthus roseus TaxID=4058 RepID=A0ACB9ZKX2_CATRO|nr:hypothetical protein M9H77_33100 [Catharanthus roseus]
MNQLKQIHANTLRNGIDFTKFLITKLIEIPDISYAHKVFDNIPNPTTFLYNKLIQAYSSHGPQHMCLSLYLQMRHKHLLPNPHSFTVLFAACSNRMHGQILHAHFVKWGFEFDVYAVTALIDMYAKMGLMHLSRKLFEGLKIRSIPTWNSLIAGYAKNGDMEEALRLFSEMPRKNVISWTTMISGYSQNGKYSDALAMYLEMENNGEQPNEVTIASVLPACANVGALEVGKRIEAIARSNGYFENIFVCNAIMEMYSRCGRIDAAMQIFDEIDRRRNLCSWNTAIMGLAAEGATPDDVTFVGSILACTHGRMVEKGRELFNSMEQTYSITPKLEHYGCMVDLLGRAGELREAYNLIQSMPMRPDSVVWGTMLGACSFYGNVELAEKAAESLFELEPWNPGNYVILSNIYARAKIWDGVAKLRKTMKGFQIQKAAGYSFIEEESQIHKFIVDDKSHPKSDQIYAILDDVHLQMKLHGHIIDVDEIDSFTEETFVTDSFTRIWKKNIFHRL